MAPCEGLVQGTPVYLFGNHINVNQVHAREVRYTDMGCSLACKGDQIIPLSSYEPEEVYQVPFRCVSNNVLHRSRRTVYAHGVVLRLRLCTLWHLGVVYHYNNRFARCPAESKTVYSNFDKIGTFLDRNNHMSRHSTQ